MNKAVITSAVIITAATAFILLSGIRSIDEFVWICCTYPLQTIAYAYNVAVVVLGYMSKSFWLLYVCALIDLVMTAAAIFTLV